jgi:hypothetical protein
MVKHKVKRKIYLCINVENVIGKIYRGFDF